MKESGRSEIQYAMADHAGGLMGGFFIHNVESAEQLAEAISEWEMVYTLDPSYEKVESNLKKAKAFLKKLKEIEKNQ